MRMGRAQRASRSRACFETGHQRVKCSRIVDKSFIFDLKLYDMTQTSVATAKAARATVLSLFVTCRVVQYYTYSCRVRCRYCRSHSTTPRRSKRKPVNKRWILTQLLAGVAQLSALRPLFEFLTALTSSKSSTAALLFRDVSIEQRYIEIVRLAFTYYSMATSHLVSTDQRRSCTAAKMRARSRGRPGWPVAVGTASLTYWRQRQAITVHANQQPMRRRLRGGASGGSDGLFGASTHHGRRRMVCRELDSAY